MSTPGITDLFVLTADSQQQATIETLLTRRRPSLGIRPSSFEIQRHANSDPGCRTDSPTLLRSLRARFSRAMVIFDLEGSGSGALSAVELEAQLEEAIQRTGWESGSVATIVIEPELEAWLFGANFTRLEQTTGWSQPQQLRLWLEERNFLNGRTVKPTDPKGAIEATLQETHRPRNAQLYQEVARHTGLAHCQDRAFRKFRDTLRNWFPAGQ